MGGDFNCNIKERHWDSSKNPQRPDHTNERNYLGVVVYSALQKTYSFRISPSLQKSVLEGWRRILVRYLTKIITKHAVLCNIQRNM
jgi:hypothetical protein